MLKTTKNKTKIKGKYEELHAEMTILLNNFIEVFGINTLKECVEDLRLISNYKLTLQELDVPKDLEKDILDLIKKNKNK